jgi:hypothetical protein
VVEENQVLIQEIQESVDEHRNSAKKQRFAEDRKDLFYNPKTTTQQAQTIDQQIRHLIGVLNRFKTHVRMKLEHSMVTMLVSNILPAYSVQYIQTHANRG